MRVTNPEEPRPLEEKDAEGTATQTEGTAKITAEKKDNVEPPTQEVSTDETEEELPAITEIHERRFSDIKDLADRFYKSMKFYKGEQWTLAKIQAHSNKLPPMLQEMEELLDLGGIKSSGQQKELLSAIVEDAQHAKSAHDFWHGISDHKTMTAKSAHDKFYRAIVSGLQERENVAEAA